MEEKDNLIAALQTKVSSFLIHLEYILPQIYGNSLFIHAHSYKYSSKELLLTIFV